MKLLIAVLLIWCGLTSCDRDHGCILTETSTKRATIKEGLPGTFYLMREGNLTRVSLRLTMKRGNETKVESIVLQQNDLPSTKSLQEVIVSTISDGNQTFLDMTLPNITEVKYDCCPNFVIKMLEVETKGGGLLVFYRCPDAITKGRIHKMAKLDGCDKAGADSGAEAQPIVRTSAWAVLTIALAFRQLV